MLSKWCNRHIAAGEEALSRILSLVLHGVNIASMC